MKNYTKLFVATLLLGVAASSIKAADKIKVVFEDDDQKELEVDKKNLEKSVTLKDMIDSMDFEKLSKDEQIIPLLNTKKAVFEKLLELLQLNNENPSQADILQNLNTSKTNSKEAIELIGAANYFDFRINNQPLIINALAQYIAELYGKGNLISQENIEETLKKTSLAPDLISRIVTRYKNLPSQIKKTLEEEKPFTINFTNNTSCIAFSKDNLLAIGFLNGQVNIYNYSDPNNPQLIKTLTYDEEPSILSLAFSQEEFLAIGLSDNTVKLYKYLSTKEKNEIELVEEIETDLTPSNIAFSNNKLLVLTLQKPNVMSATISIYDYTEDESTPIKLSQFFNNGVHATAFSNNNLLAASVGFNKTNIYNCSDRTNIKLLQTIQHESLASNVAFSKENLLAIGFDNTDIDLYDCSEPHQINKLKRLSNPKTPKKEMPTEMDIAFSANNLFATAAIIETKKIINIYTYQNTEKMELLTTIEEDLSAETTIWELSCKIAFSENNLLATITGKQLKVYKLQYFPEQDNKSPRQKADIIDK